MFQNGLGTNLKVTSSSEAATRGAETANPRPNEMLRRESPRLPCGCRVIREAHREPIGDRIRHRTETPLSQPANDRKNRVHAQGETQCYQTPFRGLPPNRLHLASHKPRFRRVPISQIGLSPDPRNFSHKLPRRCGRPDISVGRFASIHPIARPHLVHPAKQQTIKPPAHNPIQGVVLHAHKWLPNRAPAQ